LFDLGDSDAGYQVKLGSHECRFVFIVPHQSFNQDNKQQLAAICNAVHIRPDLEIQVIEQDVPGKIRIREVNTVADHFFFMGVSPGQAGLELPLPLYTFVKVGSVYIMTADDLSVLQKNVEAKKKLWMALKQHFIDGKKHVL
jgi:hypothetical protein